MIPLCTPASPRKLGKAHRNMLRLYRKWRGTVDFFAQASPECAHQSLLTVHSHRFLQDPTPLTGMVFDVDTGDKPLCSELCHFCLRVRHIPLLMRYLNQQPALPQQDVQ